MTDWASFCAEGVGVGWAGASLGDTIKLQQTSALNYSFKLDVELED